MKSHQLTSAKIYLYRLLLQIEPDELSDAEIDVMFALAQDADVEGVMK